MSGMYRQVSLKRKRSGNSRATQVVKVRKSAVPRGLRLPQEHIFKRSLYFDTAYWSNTGFGTVNNSISGSGYGCSFVFRQANIEFNVGNGAITTSAVYFIPGAGDLTGLFDQYKIARVEMSVFFSAAPQQVGNVNGYGTPTVAFLNDYDDATPLLDMATAMQYQNLKMVQFNNSTPTGGIKKKFSPKPVAAMYNTALTTGYSAVAKPVWIDMTYVNVPHYGLKCHSDSVSSLTAADTLLGRFQWKIDVIFKCKGIR